MIRSRVATGPVAPLTLLLALLVALTTPSPVHAIDRPAVPNDRYYVEQWSLAGESEFGIDLLETWRLSRGEGIVVAVVDTGITDHREFSGRVLRGYDFISDPDRARDGDGRDGDPTDEGDWLTEEEIERYGEECGPPLDSSWHGTLIAGTILAGANNRIGIAGIVPAARLLPVRVSGVCGADQEDLADALRWAAGLPVEGAPANEHPARLINVSLGGEAECDGSLRSAISELASLGVIVVAAVGNESVEASRFAPANCDGVLAVGATTRSGDRAFYSNYGERVDLSAPGGLPTAQGGVLSTHAAGRTTSTGLAYSSSAGTSMAAPHVTGLLAAALATDPQLPREDLLSLLSASLAPFRPESSCALIAGLCGGGIASGARLYASFAARATPVSGQVAPGELEIGASAPVSASIDGVDVALSLTTPQVCSYLDGMVTAIASGSCRLEARRAGSTLVQPVALQISITIPGIVPTLALALPRELRVGRRVTPLVTSSSDATPRLTSRTPKVCRIGAAGRLRAIAPGSCRVRVTLPPSALFAGRTLTVTLRVVR